MFYKIEATVACIIAVAQLVVPTVLLLVVPTVLLYVLRYYSLPVTVFRLAPGRLRGNFSTSPQVACVTMTRLGLFFRFFQRSSLVMSVVRNL